MATATVSLARKSAADGSGPASPNLGYSLTRSRRRLLSVPLHSRPRSRSTSHPAGRFLIHSIFDGVRKASTTLFATSGGGSGRGSTKRRKSSTLIGLVGCTIGNLLGSSNDGNVTGFGSGGVCIASPAVSLNLAGSMVRTGSMAVTAATLEAGVDSIGRVARLTASRSRIRFWSSWSIGLKLAIRSSSSWRGRSGRRCRLLLGGASQPNFDASPLLVTASGAPIRRPVHRNDHLRSRERQNCHPCQPWICA